MIVLNNLLSMLNNTGTFNLRIDNCKYIGRKKLFEVCLFREKTKYMLTNYNINNSLKYNASNFPKEKSQQSFINRMNSDSMKYTYLEIFVM